MNGFKLFHDRADAGIQLADKLIQYQNNPNALVLALPRGGVPVGYEIAKKLQLPFDIFLVRKLGAPFQKELAMGAIASGDVIFLNEDIILSLGISEDEIQRIISEEKRELERREIKYRQGHSAKKITEKDIILVDDGIATGASIHVTILALKKLNPTSIVLAVPVAPESTLPNLAPLVNKIVCLFPATIFYGVGAFYEDFTQTSDEEVIDLLTALHTKSP